MKPERWQQVDRLFQAALEHTPAKRAAFISEACSGDDSLRREVEALLVADGQAGSFIETPAYALAAKLIDGGDAPVIIGKRIGHYQIISLLGKGGMGEVYQARDLKLDRTVALKILPVEMSADGERMRRFNREAKAASALNHPNVAHIYEIGEVNGVSYIAMEYVEGQTLAAKINGQPLAIKEIVELGSQIADALDEAHSKGITHRDIKPANVMLTPRGQIKVLDFGLAKVARPAQPITSDISTLAKTAPGVVMGTVPYMSPEQALGLDVDHRSDIFSLGTMLYEMATGRLPFVGASTSETLDRILHAQPDAMARFNYDVPAELERIVRKCLEKERERRYQSARELFVDLKKLQRDSSSSLQPSALEHRTSGVAVARQRNRLIVLGAFLLVAATIVSAYFYSLRKNTDVSIEALAVLPFANGSDDQNLEYLSDGLSESLIDRLAQLPRLKVIARGSAFKYKGREVDPSEVANALGVQAIVTGRIVRRGDSLLVRAELVSARDKAQIWGQQYHRQAGDLLVLQSELSSEIAEQLRIRLTEGERQQLAKRATTTPQAFELVLKGNYARNKDTTAARQQALAFYQQALVLDPSYALAHAQLSRSYMGLIISGVLTPQEARPKAEAAARQAVLLDQSLAQAHLALAQLERYNWNWADAERAFQHALALQPSLAEAHSQYAQHLALQGRFEQALAETRQALSLDPLSLVARTQIAISYITARQFDQGEEALQETLTFDSTFSLAHLVLGYVYAAKAQYLKAIAAYEKAVQLGDRSPSTQIYLGYARAKAGQRAQAQLILKSLQTTTMFVSPAELAVLYLGLDDHEQALTSLERAYREHDWQLQSLKFDTHYDSLRAEPRFQSLVQRVGLL